MKFAVTIYLCLVLSWRLGNAQNEEPATDTTTLASSEIPLLTTEITTGVPESTTGVLETTTVGQETTAEPPEGTVTEPTTTPAPYSPAVTSESTSEITSAAASTVESTTAPTVESTTAPVQTNKSESKIVEKLSEQIRSILTHFQQNEPTGFPGQSILTDPMAAPNTTADLGIGTGFFYNITVHGLSKFTVEAVNMLLDEMQVYVMLRMRTVLIKGNCTIETLFTKSRGPFNITLTNVTAEGTVYLKTDTEGKLYANKSSSDMYYQELAVGSNMNSVFQTAMNGAGMVVLAAIRPYILSHIDQRINEEVNRQLQSTPKIPSITNRSPVDLAILEGRKYIRQFYEPYTIQNIANHESEHLIVKIGPATVHGLSKFARVGNVTVQMRENIVQLSLRLITGRIKGKCKWFYDFGKVGLTRQGESLFYVEHLQFEAKINQSMDLRKTPILDDLQLEVGPIHVKMDGSGNFDYLVEMSVHMVPNMLRHLLIDALEEPIKQKIQSEILDKVNVGKLVEDNLPLMESLFIY